MEKLFGGDLSPRNLIAEAVKEGKKVFNSADSTDLQGQKMDIVSGNSRVLLKCNLENNGKEYQEVELDLNGFKFGYNNRDVYEASIDGKNTLIYIMTCLSKNGPVILTMKENDVFFTARLFGLKLKPIDNPGANS